MSKGPTMFTRLLNTYPVWKPWRTNSTTHMSNLTYCHLLITVQKCDTTCERTAFSINVFSAHFSLAFPPHARQSVLRDKDGEPARPAVGLYVCRVPLGEVRLGEERAIREVSEVLLRAALRGGTLVEAGEEREVGLEVVSRRPGGIVIRQGMVCARALEEC